MAILVGTSGWSYKEWVGPFYPPDLGDPADWLPHYGKFFRTAEINSSFYAWPGPHLVDGWVRTAKQLDRFRFSLKLPQSLSHELLVRGSPGELRAEAARFDTEVLTPLADGKVLGSILVQAPPSFTKDSGGKALRRLESLLDGFHATRQVTVELRHRTWVADGRLAKEAGKVLGAHNATLCVTDGPGFPAIEPATGDHRYIRFHGRNEEAWFRKRKGSSGDAPEDEEPAGTRGSGRSSGSARYDYLYSEEQLLEWANTISEKWGNRETYVYFNNHPYGKAPKNALEMMDLLGIPHPPKRVLITTQGTLDAPASPEGHKGWIGESDPVNPHWRPVSKAGSAFDVPRFRTTVDGSKPARSDVDPAGGAPSDPPDRLSGPRRVLFLCGANSCRSQMAEAWARHLLAGTVEPFSAGATASTVNPAAVKVMAEAGVDTSSQRSKSVEALARETFDLVITLCDEAREACPIFPGPQVVVHRSFDDPARTGSIADFRRVRDEIRALVEGIPTMLAEVASGRSPLHRRHRPGDPK